jgi:hypothetical protein
VRGYALERKSIKERGMAVDGKIILKCILNVLREDFCYCVS